MTCSQVLATLGWRGGGGEPEEEGWPVFEFRLRKVGGERGVRFSPLVRADYVEILLGEMGLVWAVDSVCLGFVKRWTCKGGGWRCKRWTCGRVEVDVWRWTCGGGGVRGGRDGRVR